MLDILDSIFVKKYFTLSGRASRREYWTGQFVFWLLHGGAAAFSLFIFKTFFIYPDRNEAAAMGIKFVTACFVFSLPTYVWRHMGLLLLVLIAGFVGLAVMPAGEVLKSINDFLRFLVDFIRPVVLPAMPVLLTTLYLLPTSIALTVRRFHDRNMPGVTLFLIPEFVGFIIDLLAGSRKTNRYGEPPVL